MSGSRGTSKLKDGIFPVEPGDTKRVVEVWESSVRATHDFLQEGDVEIFEPIVREVVARRAVELVCMRDAEGSVAGFAGVADGKLEMLFVAPEWRGRGIGARLVRHVVDAMSVVEVDVNEQNDQAVGFYRRMGFEVTGRSETDSMGKPYPLLHMRLPERAD